MKIFNQDKWPCNLTRKNGTSRRSFLKLAAASICFSAFPAMANDLLSMPVLLFETQPVLHAFIGAATGSNFDLADLLIAHSAKGHPCESVLTFDKKAAKFAGFELIK